MIIDGREIAQKIENKLSKEVKNLKNPPFLAVILVGKNPASEIYVTKKQEAAKRIGIKAKVYKLSQSTTEQKLLNLIKRLNRNKKIDGILVQLPLPKQINPEKVFENINPKKDIDCLNPCSKCLPPTAQAVVEIIKSSKINLVGKEVCLIGYSVLCNKPLADFLVKKGATVTVCQKQTKNLKKFTKNVDIIITAVGKPKLIKKDMIKNNAIIIDVGISKIGKKVVGDSDFENVKAKASFVTPVPGGIGPITISMLFSNLLDLSER